MSVEGYEPTLITDIDAETYKKIEDVDMGEKGANWASGIFYLKFVDQNGKVHYYKDYATQWDEEKEYYQLVLPTYYEKEISIVTTNVTLKEIITELLYEYGGEPYYNIVINDLPEQGQELLEYRSQTPLYLVQNLENQQYQWYLDDTVEFPLVLDDEEIIYVYKSDVTKEDVETGNYYLETDDNEYTQTNVWYETGKYYKKVYNYQDNNRLALKDFTDDQLEFFKGLVKNENSATIDLREEDADERVLGKVMKIEFGQTIGYRPTDLVYAGELVCNVGENVTTVLDKIKNMLGSFEYFYNLDGQFVFQAKPTFLNNSFSQFFKTEDTEFYDVKKQKYSYSFTDSKMFTTLSTAPNIANLKNNFTVWGERKGVTGNTLPMHMVYAIMEKPKKYKGFPITMGKKGNILLKNNKQCQYTFFTEDYPQLEEELKKYPYIEDDIYNECFVVDWRELIYQMAYDNSRYGTIGSDHFIQNYFLILRKNNPTLCNNDRGLTGYEPFYKDLLGFWRELYNPFLESEKNTHYLYDVEDYFNETSKYKWWTRNILYPELLNFWIDFLDTEGEIGKYSMKKIGNRPKNVNDTSVKGICFKEVPPIIFVEEYLPNPDPGYHYIKFNENYLDYFSISAQGKDAQTWINDAVYQNSIVTESVTIASMPIYYLQPNTIINVFNEDLKLDGEYIINRLSYSLSHNGTMSITALKNQPYIT